MLSELQDAVRQLFTHQSSFFFVFSFVQQCLCVSVSSWFAFVVDFWISVSCYAICTYMVTSVVVYIEIVLAWWFGERVRSRSACLPTGFSRNAFTLFLNVLSALARGNVSVCPFYLWMLFWLFVLAMFRSFTHYLLLIQSYFYRFCHPEAEMTAIPTSGTYELIPFLVSLLIIWFWFFPSRLLKTSL